MAMRDAFGATGVTLFQNEDAPDQDLSHLHVHVVPRRSGDDFRLPDPNIEVVSHQERRRQALELQRALGLFPGQLKTS
jgi:diadenosine tetraphosphate (Ap4A) HIT family hydrolase